MTDKELIEEIEETMLVIGDFWEADEDEQQKALEIANACMRYILRTMEGSR